MNTYISAILVGTYLGVWISASSAHGTGKTVDIDCSAKLTNNESSEPTVYIKPRIGFSEDLLKKHNALEPTDGSHSLPVNSILITNSGEKVPYVYNYRYEISDGSVARHFITYSELFYLVEYGTIEAAERAEKKFGDYPEIQCSIRAG